MSLTEFIIKFLSEIIGCVFLFASLFCEVEALNEVAVEGSLVSVD